MEWSCRRAAGVRLRRPGLPAAAAVKSTRPPEKLAFNDVFPSLNAFGWKMNAGCTI